MFNNSFYVISRFGNDSVLYNLALKVKTKKRGHPQWFDGKIVFTNLDLT